MESYLVKQNPLADRLIHHSGKLNGVLWGNDVWLLFWQLG
jgi:hypothetical protein